LTQEQLAAQSECDVKTVRKAEKSGHVDQSIVESLSQTLGIEPRNLIDTALLDREGGDIEIAMSWLDTFNQRDAERLAELYHEEGTLKVMMDDKLLGGGLFIGRTGVTQWASVCFDAMLTEQVTHNMFQIDVAGCFVFVRSIRDLQVTSLRTNQHIYAPVACEFQMRMGKIWSHRIFSDTDAIARLLSEAE
jgi:ketosteroid isomerase-like protein